MMPAADPWCYRTDPPPQHHPMHGIGVGADFHEMWSEAGTIPELTSGVAREPNERPFTIMPAAGHLLRILDVYPLKDGGQADGDASDADLGLCGRHRGRTRPDSRRQRE